MKFRLFILLFLITVFFSGCGIVEGIFRAGMWWAFILMALVVGGILYIVMKAKKK